MTIGLSLPANPVEAKSAPAKKTQPRERKAPGAKKGTKRSGMKQDEHEIAEALFDLATLARRRRQGAGRQSEQTEETANDQKGERACQRRQGNRSDGFRCG